jgi:hypothetical protein
VGGLRYYEMVYQWSRKRSQLLVGNQNDLDCAFLAPPGTTTSHTFLHTLLHTHTHTHTPPPSIHPPAQPRTVMVTEEGELLIVVEDLRQDPTLPLPLANPGSLTTSDPGSYSASSPSPSLVVEVERGASADSGGGRASSSLGLGLGGQSRTDKFSPVPMAGEKVTVLLR